MQITRQQKLILRQTVLTAMRGFFEQQGFLEVIIPVLNETVPLEPTIYPFETKWLKANEGQKSFYLATSPEKALKKYLAEGVEKCFGLGHCFRNLEGAGKKHLPEFLMLEWYRYGENYEQIMADVKELVLEVRGAVFEKKRELGVVEGGEEGLVEEDGATLVFQGQVIDLKNWQVLSVADLWREKIGVDLGEVIDDEKMMNLARERGYEVAGANWEQIFNQIFLNEVEVDFGAQPFFLIDFPARISPLCQPKKEAPYLANRFEFYIGGMEIGNGNNEHINADLVKKFFLAEKLEREKRGDLSCLIDEKFLENLRKMKVIGEEWAGIGLGFDRLTMLMLGAEDIEEVSYFLG